jgi:hypothetical protein
VSWVLLSVAAGYVAFRTKDRVALRVAAVSSITLLTLGNPLVSALMLKVSPYMVERLAAFMLLPLFVVLAWSLSVPWSRDWKVAAKIVAIVVSLALLFVGVPEFVADFTTQAVGSFAWSRAVDLRVKWGPDLEGRLAATFGTGRPMVVGGPGTIYELAGVSSARVAVVPDRHSPFWFERDRGPAARADMALLLDPTTAASRRREIIARYGARFIALDTWYAAERTALATLTAEGYPVVTKSGTLVILRAQ